MSGTLITPNSVPVAMGLSIHGLELPGSGVGPLPLEALFRLVALHALLQSGGATLAISPQLPVLVQRAAQAGLDAAQVVPAPAAAKDAAPAVKVQEG